MTFLLRNTSVFEKDEQMQSFIKSGKAQLVQGDALNIDDVQQAWQKASLNSEDNSLDLVLFTVGAC